MLKLIEWRWGLEPLTQRDASHAPTDPGNLATALNFPHPVTKVPELPVLPPFTPTACGASTTPTTEPPGIAPADFSPAPARRRRPDSWAALARSPLMEDWADLSASVA